MIRIKKVLIALIFVAAIQPTINSYELKSGHSSLNEEVWPKSISKE